MNLQQEKMSDQDFDRLSQFIYSNYGIKMPPTKRSMLQARLQKRLRAHQLTSFKDYCDLLFANGENTDEIINMIDVVSTNKTDFFREPNHFDFLRSQILPAFSIQKQSSVKIWSAGCSSGEEVYTIAMVISEFGAALKNLDYSILGTDISYSILKKAVNAIYSEERIAGIPVKLKKNYFLRSKEENEKLVRLVPKIRSKARYQRLNLMDYQYENVPHDFDVIFCRNVLIYFDKATQERVINNLCKHLKPGGYFFLGHSESIMNMKVPLKQIKPTIYYKVG